MGLKSMADEGFGDCWGKVLKISSGSHLKTGGGFECWFEGTKSQASCCRLFREERPRSINNEEMKGFVSDRSFQDCWKGSLYHLQQQSLFGRDSI